jgi:5-methylcytosine-specific restriction enzyme subunit McrC
MRRLQLTEFRTEAAVKLSAAEVDSLRRLYPGIRIEPAIGGNDRYDVTCDQRIGIIGLPSITIEIRPKVPISSVFFLISYCCDAVRWSEQLVMLGEELDLVEMLAIMLARVVQHATRRGLLAGYQTEEASLPAPRGRMLFDEQLRRHAGSFPPVATRHDVFTSDIIENRLLLAAVNVMARIRYRSERTPRELYRAQRLLGGVRQTEFHPAAVPDVIFTKLNHHYEPAVTLARTVLRSVSLNLADGGASGYAFLVDMNFVFEQFVRTALREALPSSSSRFPDRPPETLLDTAGRIPLRPDLCLLGEKRKVLWVGDVKYKRLPAGGYRHPDLYQLLAYSIALNLPGGTLIYAADEGLRSADHIVNHAERRLRTIAIDLSAPPARILAQFQVIAAEIEAEVLHQVAG